MDIQSVRGEVRSNNSKYFILGVYNPRQIGRKKKKIASSSNDYMMPKQKYKELEMPHQIN